MKPEFSKDFKLGVLYGYSKASAKQIVDSPDKSHLSPSDKVLLEDRLATELFMNGLDFIDSDTK